MKTFLAMMAVVLLGAGSAFAHNCSEAGSISAKACASDGSLLDTDAAMTYIKGRAEDGWVLTVGVAGGSYNWSATDLYELRVEFSNTFTLKGASPTNRPTIATNMAMLILSLAQEKVVTVKDFIFSSTRADYFMYLAAADTDEAGWRITNVKFDLHPGPARLGIIYGGWGLIDNCEFYGPATGWYILPNGSDDWPITYDTPIDFGTQKSIVFEDNLIHSDTFVPTGGPFLDPWRGGSYMFRYNTVINRAIAAHGADHDSNQVQSALKAEVMHNTFTVAADSVSNCDNLIFWRGGTGVMFDNDGFITGTGSGCNALIAWQYYRASAFQGPANTLFDRFYNALSTTIASGSNGASLPQATIHVASTYNLLPIPGYETLNQPYTTIDNIKVTTGAGVQTVSCTGKTLTTFTGCTGGTGTMTTGGAVTRASDYLGTQQPGSGPIVTTLTGSVTLPQSTINVTSTVHFPSNPGAIVINNSVTGLTCTGKTATTLTGCTGGTGSYTAGQYIGSIGQDPRYPTRAWGSMPVGLWSNTFTGTGAGLVVQIDEGSGFLEYDRDIYNWGGSDKTEDTGTWLDTYTELEYPHPLRSGEVESGDPPLSFRAGKSVPLRRR